MIRYRQIFLILFLGFLFILGLMVNPVGATQQTCPYYEDTDRILKLTTPLMQGEDVENLQLELQALGYYKGSITGYYDAMTQQSVRQFQSDHRLNADGVVDEPTWYQMARQIEMPVTNAEVLPPPTGKIALIVDTTKRKLTVMSDGKPYKQFNVACGAPETPSPVGSWQVAHKAINWGTGFGTRWLGLNVPWGIYGIHGTNKPFSIGTYASHGCIRMHNSSVEQLYPWVPKSAPVYVIGSPFGVPGQDHKILVQGDRGSDVYEIQRTLKRLGYYSAEVDGIFGPGMERAVIKFRKAYGLPMDNQVNEVMYQALGL